MYLRSAVALFLVLVNPEAIGRSLHLFIEKWYWSENKKAFKAYALIGFVSWRRGGELSCQNVRI
jgi:hypothetical protein